VYRDLFFFANETIFQNAGTERMRITSAGNVGIGTTSPFSKLTVSRPGINEGTISFDDQANNAHLTLAGTDSLVRLQLGTYNNGNYGGWIQASYDNGGVNYGTEPLILNPQGGNVGIGTTSPGQKLEVNGNIKGGYGIFNAESLTEDLRVGGIYGNLGLYIADAYDMQFSIGSTNSKWKFTLANVDKFVITPNGDTTANGSMVWGNGTGRIISNQLQSGYNTASDNLDFWLNYTGYQGGASYFRDTRIGNGKTGLIAKFEGSTGNVGIGTDSPSGPFHVKVGTSTPLIVASSSYCNNVGIRTTTPTASLQVKGNVSYSYNNYTNVATTWVNVFNMASYPTGLYQVSIIKKTNASAYITAIIKWDATASASTAGTIVNTITSNQLGVSFNGSTTLQSISALATGTLMSANLQCLVTNEDFCS
jgi:hypothetical protein